MAAQVCYCQCVAEDSVHAVVHGVPNTGSGARLLGFATSSLVVLATSRGFGIESVVGSKR